MNYTPPAIVIGKQGYFEVWKDFQDTRALSTYEFIKRRRLGALVYDADGKKWKIEELKPTTSVGFFQTILSLTVYNPALEAEFKLLLLGEYELRELKDRLLGILRSDDDVLTQFKEESTIENALGNAKDFSEALSAILMGIQE